MKRYIRETCRELDFSLHDAKIIDFTFHYDKNCLVLTTDNGFIDIKRDQMVDGNIRIEGVSADDSYVYIMEYKNVLCGNVGSFSGEKMTLDTFIRAFPVKFLAYDVYDEFHAWRTFVMDGFMLPKGDVPEILEVRFEIYYTGRFIYEAED